MLQRLLELPRLPGASGPDQGAALARALATHAAWRADLLGCGLGLVPGPCGRGCGEALAVLCGDAALAALAHYREPHSPRPAQPEGPPADAPGSPRAASEDGGSPRKEETVNHTADLAAYRPPKPPAPMVPSQRPPLWDNSPGPDPRRQALPWRSRRRPYPDAPPRPVPGCTLGFWDAEEGAAALAADPALAAAQVLSRAKGQGARSELGSGPRPDWPPAAVRLRQPAEGVYAAAPTPQPFRVCIELSEGGMAARPALAAAPPDGPAPAGQRTRAAADRATAGPDPEQVPKRCVEARRRRRLCTDVRGRARTLAPALPPAHFPDAAPALANVAYLAANAAPVRAPYFARCACGTRAIKLHANPSHAGHDTDLLGASMSVRRAHMVSSMHQFGCRAGRSCAACLAASVAPARMLCVCPVPTQGQGMWECYAWTTKWH